VVDRIDRAAKALERRLCDTIGSSKCRVKRGKKQTVPAAEPSGEVNRGLVPIPRPKPDGLGMAPEVAVIPIPRRKPQVTGVRRVDVIVESSKNTTTPGKTLGLPETPYDAACHKTLAGLGVTFSPEATPASSGGCTVVDPVRLQSADLAAGQVEFPDGPLLNCVFAARFATWLREEGGPAVGKAGSPLGKLYTGPGYECRGRNGDNSAKISEHGTGNAIDMTFVKLRDGRTLKVADVSDKTSAAHGPLSAMRASACGYFTTVLGPGANAAHDSHFHFDLGKHGKTGTYRICE
jgi:hypothetical protein